MAARTDPDHKKRAAAWRLTLDTHGAEHGAHLRLGEDHGALLTEDGETLLVTFESAATIRDQAQGALPFGLEVAGREGFSQLCLYSETDGTFRAPEVYAYFDRLVDEGFFDEFDEVVFFGVGLSGYAAATYSVAAPGARVIAIAPVATLAPDRAGWDKRFPELRRHDFTSRYGYAPAMCEAAEQVFILFDPQVREDAMHASHFHDSNITSLRCPGFGAHLAHELHEMGVLASMIRHAAHGRLTSARFFELLRKRREHGPYLRRLVVRLDRAAEPWRMGLVARHALTHFDWPRLRKALADAEAALSAEGRSLPAPRRAQAAAE